MTVAAIYARKSTDQGGVADEAKSTARQIARAREFAHGKGWQVNEQCVFVDEGISGAEFARRPGFVRLMNTLKPSPPFQVLIMSEESRLGREAIETAFALKQLIQAGVRVFFYLEGRERTFDSPMDKLLMSVTAFADELEREKARQRTSDALRRKAALGHVTGGRVFGYRNVEVRTTDERRSHVEREIKEVEAAVIREVFALSADGVGFTTIAKRLNARLAPCPRAEQGRPDGWSGSSIREVLNRELYRGKVVYNRSQKRNAWGEKKPSARPRDEWMEVERPELRIITDEAWHAVRSRLQQMAHRYPLNRNGGRSHGNRVKYLLSGIARCWKCNASIEARTVSYGSTAGRRRVGFYGCSTYSRKGAAVCDNSLTIPIETADAAVLALIEAELLKPDTADAIVRNAYASLRSDGGDVEALDRRIAQLDREIERYAAAIGAAPDVDALVKQIENRNDERADLTARRAASTTHRTATPLQVQTALRARLEDWRTLLEGQPEARRRILEAGLIGRLTFTADEDAEGKYYRISGEGSLLSLAGSAVPLGVASPPGFEPGF